MPLRRAEPPDDRVIGLTLRRRRRRRRRGHLPASATPKAKETVTGRETVTATPKETVTGRETVTATPKARE
jgi:hypothetical protein